MIPGGPRNARQMQMMMRRLGMTTETVDDVQEVIVRTSREEHVFTRPEVTILTVQGVRTYQVVGEPQKRARSAEPSTGAAPSAPSGPAEEDVRLVMEQTQVSREEAIDALRESQGAPAEAILLLLSRRGGGE